MEKEAEAMILPSELSNPIPTSNSQLPESESDSHSGSESESELESDSEFWRFLLPKHHRTLYA